MEQLLTLPFFVVNSIPFLSSDLASTEASARGGKSGSFMGEVPLPSGF